MSSTAEDVEFLRDQVHRLSLSLTRYQTVDSQPHKEGGPLPVKTGASTLATAPWLTNKRYLSPLLAEYDVTLKELNQEIDMYKAELESMRSRVEQVTDENSRLHSEVRKSLEARIEVATQKSGSLPSSSPRLSLEALQQQLDTVVRDRDSYRELLKKTSQELDLLQKSDQNKSTKLLECKAELLEAQQASIAARKNAGELEFNCAKLDEERNRCLKTVQAQDAELSALQDNLSQVKLELKAATSKNQDLKKALDEITFQLKKRETERAKALDTESSADDRFHIMQITNADLEGKLLACQKEMAILSGEKADLEETLSSVQGRVSALEQREYEAVCHVKDSMQIAESALLEKEQAHVKEQQLVKEVERLKLAMATILKEAGERTKREASMLREECNKSIDKMAVEIHRLEQECGDWQAQLERSQREKKVAEKELERVLAQKPLEVAQTGENLHELQKRVCVAERAKDNALVKLEGLTAANKRLESTLSEEKQSYAQLSEEHRRWQRQVQEEGQKLREQKIKAMAETDGLKQKLRQSNQAKEAAEMRLVQELASMERKQEVREREIKYRLESAEEAHHKSIQELRGLLAAQHKVGAKWREETKSMAIKSEQTIAELRSELARYRSRSEELSKQLKHWKHVKDDLEKRLRAANNCNSGLQERVKMAEAQSEGALEQVTLLVSREKQLLQERRDLNRQLDKIKLQVSRTSTLPGPHYSFHSTLSKQHTSAPHLHQQGSHLLPPPLLPCPTRHQENSSEWNQTLTQLNHSIQQVKKGLGLAGAGGHTYSVEGGEAEEGTLSECSVLSRADLSHSSRSLVS